MWGQIKRERRTSRPEFPVGNGFQGSLSSISERNKDGYGPGKPDPPGLSPADWRVEQQVKGVTLNKDWIWKGALTH